MSYFVSCPFCGANLDPGDKCDCVGSLYQRLTPANRGRFDTRVAELLAEQRKTAPVLQHGDGAEK